MWNGTCTIYDSPHYPRGCDSYKCKLLRELLDESISLSKALKVIKQAKGKIHNVEKLLPVSSYSSFRDRLIEQIERLQSLPKLSVSDVEFQSQANDLLEYFDKQFGVNDFLDLPEAK